MLLSSHGPFNLRETQIQPDQGEEKYQLCQKLSSKENRRPGTFPR